METFLRIGLFGCVAGLGVGTIWLGSIGQTGGASAAAGLSFGLCIFLYLTRFKRFKGLGFEGELWEQEMEKAAEIQRALRDLSERVGENVFWQLGPGSRWGGGNAEKIFGIIERTDRNLQAIGVDPQRIEELKRPWHMCVMRDLADPIVVRVREIISEKTKALDPEIAALGSPMPAGKMPQLNAIMEKKRAMGEVVPQLNDLIWRDDFGSVPRLLRDAIDTSPWLTPKDREELYSNSAEELQDIDQYARDRTIRRPETLKL